MTMGVFALGTWVFSKLFGSVSVLCLLAALPVVVLSARRSKNKAGAIAPMPALTPGAPQRPIPLIALPLFVPQELGAGTGQVGFLLGLCALLAVSTTLFANTNNAGAVVAGVLAGSVAQLSSYRAVCGRSTALNMLSLGLW